MTLSLGTAMEDPDLGTEYQLVQKIGGGAYSTVWQAIHKSTGVKVAVKKEDNIFDDFVDCKRVLREIKLLRKLEHPNIVKLLDLRVTEEHDYFESICLVLEMGDLDMKKLIKSTQNLELLHIKKLVYNTLLSLLFIHSAGVIHRDLKPGNVLIYSDCTAKVCDFGLARTLVGTSSSSLKKKKIPEQESDEEIDLDNPEEGVANSTASKILPGVKAKLINSVEQFEEKKKKKKEIKKIVKKKEDKVSLEKMLTSHVVTRWYRAPEIILMEKDYGEGIDVWAVGCIFAELLSMLKGNASSCFERKPLFPGTSCFPLSPGHAAQEAENDQLNVIFDVLGSPSESDCSFVTDEEKLAHLKSLPPKKRIDFRSKYPKASPQALDLLNRMLLFNPYKRITIEDALNHDFFSDIRDKSQYLLADEWINFDFEAEKELDEDRLRELFQEELGYYRKIREEGRLDDIIKNSQHE